MALVQSFESARVAHVGEHGVADDDFASMLARAEGALVRLRSHYADRSLPLLRLPERRDDLDGIRTAAQQLIEEASDIVILGTGGSSLGGQTLAQLAGHAVPGVGMLRRGPRLHFMDNLDPDSFGSLLENLPLATSRFVAISKSGGTGETLMQTAAVVAALREEGLESYIGDMVLGLSEPVASNRRNGLRDLLAPYCVPVLDHDPGVGGRFSVLTNVGLLPAAMLGLDIAALRAGAARALTPVLDSRPPEEVSAAVGAALSVVLASHKPITVLMAYADRLERFTRWYVQLWAESLGKDGRGTTPLGALGPVDQHSQLQLFIAGPRDKLFTIITVDRAGRGPRIDSELAVRCGEPDFAGRSIGDLVAAQGRATAETLARNGCPVRTMHLDRLDETTVGELLMHFMLETVIAADLLGVDAFDQPAVEEGKLLAKQYLRGG